MFLLWPGLTVLRSAAIILRKFCLLCYKHVIAMSPRKSKDKVPFVCSNCQNSENTREKYSLIPTRHHVITYTKMIFKAKINHEVKCFLKVNLTC